MKGRRVFRSALARKNMYGYLFTLPLVVGFICFFAYPFAQSVAFSLSKLVIGRQGYRLEYVGLENYRHALFVDAEYVRTLTETVVKMVSDVPLILAFSFFAALLLNQKFKGRSIARVVFFLPVIYGAGIVLKMESTDYMSTLHAGEQSIAETVRLGASLRNFLMQMRLPESLLTYILQAIDRIPEIVRSSGIQILIFLAGLQSISPELYEAADVEGAGKWEAFWKITFPLMGPLTLTNVVYSVVDSFTSGRNTLMIFVNQTAFGSSGGYGLSSAMAWMYFAVVAAFLAVIAGIISRGVFYRE